MRRCKNSIGEILCSECNNQVNGNKEFEAKLNEKKDKIRINLVMCFLFIKYKIY